MALQLGMTRRELLRRVGADELAEWWAFWQLNPWGQARADLRMARQCFEMHRCGESPEDHITMSQFIPDFTTHLDRGDDDEMDLETMRAGWNAWCIAMNTD